MWFSLFKDVSRHHFALRCTLKKILCCADSQKAVLVNVKNDLEQKNSKVVGGFVLNKINWHSSEKNLH